MEVILSEHPLNSKIVPKIVSIDHIHSLFEPLETLRKCHYGQKTIVGDECQERCSML